MTDFRATGMHAVEIGRDGKLVRLEFVTPDGNVGISMLAKNLAALIPLLVKAEAESGVKAAEAARTVFDVSAVDVAIPADNDGIIMALTLPLGHEGGMSFRLDIESARRLSETLGVLVALSGDSKKTVK